LITKAYITEILDKKTVKVRIPLYNKIAGVAGSTPDSELSNATLCYPSGVIPNYKINDVVFVQFEDNYLDKPIILGKLKSTTSGTEDGILPDIYCDNFKSTGKTILSEDTTIGEIDYTTIKCLKNTKNNIKQSFSDVDKQIADIHKIIGVVSPDAEPLANSIATLQSTVNTKMESLSGGVGDLKSAIGGNIPLLDNELSLTKRVSLLEETKLNNPIVLDKYIGYGNEFPDSPVDGQLFFKFI
jgi:hypothetical protein